MKISYNWLKEFVDIKVGPQKLADDLSLFGHEVEKIEKIACPERSRGGNDYMLDFEITPNRGDLLSIFGMAREIAALYDLKLKTKNSKLQLNTQSVNKELKILIKNKGICQRYTARIIDKIKIKESPKWIKERLRSYGFRPINNIVDITNYLMIETGQPLHAFDYDKIANGNINIRLSKSNESLITLDGKEKIFGYKSIVICDGEKIYDLAGIMGGFNSEVDKNTKTIILEAAIFNPVLIRRTSKQLKLITDASYRYERGVDPEGTINALNRATELVDSTCNNSRSSRIFDITNDRDSSVNIVINDRKINSLLGIKMSQEKIKSYLERLNFKINKSAVTVPSYRKYDVKIWQDIAEEVARMHGYSKLSGQKLFSISAELENNDEFTKKEYIKDVLVKNGFSEIYSYSFANEKLITILNKHCSDHVFDLDNCQQVINSVDPELKYLRPTLMPSLLDTIAKNPWAPNIKLFEIGKVFYSKYPNEEKWQLGIATTGKQGNKIVNNLSKLLEIDIKIYQITQQVLDYKKIRIKSFIWLADLDRININIGKINYKMTDRKFKPISKYPPTIRDFAFIVDRKTDSESIIKDISNLDDRILIVELFDEFISDKLGKNKKNIAYHVWMQDMEKPMDNFQAEKIGNKIIKEIITKYRAKLRS